MFPSTFQVWINIIVDYNLDANINYDHHQACGGWVGGWEITVRAFLDTGFMKSRLSSLLELNFIRVGNRVQSLVGC